VSIYIGPYIFDFDDVDFELMIDIVIVNVRDEMR